MPTLGLTLDWQTHSYTLYSESSSVLVFILCLGSTLDQWTHGYTSYSGSSSVLVLIFLCLPLDQPWINGLMALSMLLVSLPFLFFFGFHHLNLNYFPGSRLSSNHDSWCSQPSKHFCIYTTTYLNWPASNSDGSIDKYIQLVCPQYPSLHLSSEPQPFVYFPGSRPRSLSNNSRWLIYLVVDWFWCSLKNKTNKTTSVGCKQGFPWKCNPLLLN